MYKPMLFTEIQQYNRRKFSSDLLAGITVGIIALPLAMAFAIAAGLPPEKGLFTAIVAGTVISVMGGCHVQIGGPTGAFVIIISGICTQYGFAGLAICTLMAGMILILFGLFQMGGLIKFIPFPVTTGFTSGIAVVIFSTQIKDLLGLNIETAPATFIDKWCSYLANINSVNISAAAIGIGTIILIRLIQLWKPRLPAMLIALVAATVIVNLFEINVETIAGRFGELPRIPPMPSLPDFNLAKMTELIRPAFTVAILAAVESLLSATVADGMTGCRHRPNAELIGMGLANIASPLFGGIPATGAIARTATNIKCGAQTPVAGIIHAATLALLLLVLAPAAGLIPLSSLAGILVIVSYNMSERNHFTSICKGPRSDMFVLLLTFTLTVLVDLTMAVQIGVVLSALLFIRRMAEITNVSMITKEVRGDQDVAEDPNSIMLREIPDGVEVFEVTGPFFFGMIDTFRNAMSSIEIPVAVLILRIRDVLAIDATGLHVLRELYHKCLKDQTHLIFSGVHAQPLTSFIKSGLLQEIGAENFLGNIDDALNRARVLLDIDPVPRPAHFVPTVARESNLATDTET